MNKAEQLGLTSDLIDVQDSGNKTALIYASSNGHEHIVQLLISRNASVKVKSSDTGKQAIHYAAWQGRLKVMEVLLDTYPELVYDKDNWEALGRTPLQIAKQYKHDHIIKWLSKEMGVKY